MVKWIFYKKSQSEDRSIGRMISDEENIKWAIAKIYDDLVKKIGYGMEKEMAEETLKNKMPIYHYKKETSLNHLR